MDHIANDYPINSFQGRLAALHSISETGVVSVTEDQHVNAKTRVLCTEHFI